MSPSFLVKTICYTWRPFIIKQASSAIVCAVCCLILQISSILSTNNDNNNNNNNNYYYYYIYFYYYLYYKLEIEKGVKECLSVEHMEKKYKLSSISPWTY